MNSEILKVKGPKGFHYRELCDCVKWISYAPCWCNIHMYKKSKTFFKMKNCYRLFLWFGHAFRLLYVAVNTLFHHHSWSKFRSTKYESVDCILILEGFSANLSFSLVASELFSEFPGFKEQPSRGESTARFQTHGCWAEQLNLFFMMLPGEANEKSLSVENVRHLFSDFPVSFVIFSCIVFPFPHACLLVSYCLSPWLSLFCCQVLPILLSSLYVPYSVSLVCCVV